MKTVYIKGRSHYRKGLRKILDKCDLHEGRDFMEGLGGSNEFALVWIREDLDLREFKRAIGAKFIWKHRLRFYSSIEEMNPKKTDVGFNESEIALMNQVKKYTEKSYGKDLQIL